VGTAKHQRICHEVSIQIFALLQVLTSMKKSFLEGANMLWLGLL
jgi:hypothetical protein